MERAKEGVAILLNNVWHSAMVKFGFFSSRIHWIKFKFSRVKVYVVLGYGPNEDGEERDRFWNNMDRTLNNVVNGYRLCILGDLNGWIRDRTRAGITGAFGVSRMIIVEEWCSFAQKGDWVWVTHILSTEVYISTQEWQRVETVWRLRA